MPFRGEPGRAGGKARLTGPERSGDRAGREAATRAYVCGMRLERRPSAVDVDGRLRLAKTRKMDFAARKRRPIRVRLALALLLLPAPLASGDIVVYRDGSRWAEIAKDGSVYVGGSRAGEIEQDGSVFRKGRRVGEVEQDGELLDGGTRAGEVELDGDIFIGGSRAGTIESNGDLFRRGSRWGSAADCCSSPRDGQRVLALLYFFDSGFFE